MLFIVDDWTPTSLFSYCVVVSAKSDSMPKQQRIPSAEGHLDRLYFLSLSPFALAVLDFGTLVQLNSFNFDRSHLKLLQYQANPAITRQAAGSRPSTLAWPG